MKECIEAVEYAFVECAYRQVRGEDGNYDAMVGYNVLARTTAEKPSGAYATMIHITYDDDESWHTTLFKSEEEAKNLAYSVNTHKEINCNYWDWVSSGNIYDLPDYILNPNRPEYN